MVNKKMFKSAAVITTVMLSVSGCAGGCSKQAEPVIADSAAETPEPEESIETKEPTPSPTVEPAEESIDDTVSSESEDNKETENIKHGINVSASGIFYCLKEFTFYGFIKLYE